MAIWPHLWPTLLASVLGTLIDMRLGAIVGSTRYRESLWYRSSFCCSAPTLSSPIVVAVMVVFISVVTAEISQWTLGIGRLLATATRTADSTLTFALVVVVSGMGLPVLGIADFIKGRVLHWWGT